MNITPFGKRKEPPPPDLRPRTTKIGLGGVAVLITWTHLGPVILPAQSSFQQQEG